MDTSEVRNKSDDELLDMVSINPPGHVRREAAKTELELRNARRLIEFATSTEKSGKRMEWATWIVLFATLVQLGLAVIPMVPEHYHRVSSLGSEQKQVAGPQVASPDKTDEQVKADTKTWENAEVDVTCSSKEPLFSPWYSTDGKSKQVTLTCTIKNLTDKPVPLATPAKVDALFLLPDHRVVRGHAYLGSSQHQIPPRGEIRDAGLFPGDNDCSPKQSNYDCVQDELMKANELLLTDTVSGVRYHVRVE
jgi:hypothetical protein